MNDTLNSLADKLPDVHFDWYARVLPGIYGLALAAYFLGYAPTLTPTMLIVWLLGGYLLGHVLQPLVGWIVKALEKRLGNEARYRSAKSNTAVSASLLGKVSKAHAEANSMLAFAILSMPWIICARTPRQRWIMAAVSVYFLLMTYERVRARDRKINDLP